MTQQGQGDVVSQLERPHAVSILSMSKEALGASLNKAWDEVERLRTLLSSSRGEQGLARLEPVVRGRLTDALKDFLIYYHGTDEQQEELQADFSGPDGLLSDAEVRSLVFRNAQKALAESWELDGTLPSAPGSVPTSLAGQHQMRPHGGIAACYDCNRPYGDEFGFPDLVLPNDVWSAISPTKNEGGLLCPSCICKRLHSAGIETHGVFRSGPLSETSLAGQVPNGYVLVPKEPTEEMVLAGQDPHRPEGTMLTAESVIHRYRAMLSAAPQPTAGGDAPAGVWPDFIAPPQYENPCEGWSDPALPPFRTIWEVARSCGYAVGLHGSMKRDVDLIAAPWVENADASEQLINSLCDALNARMVGPIESKPLGRLAATIQIDAYVKPIDISVMPKDALSAERARVIEECAAKCESYGTDYAKMLAAALRALGQQDTGGADHG